MCVCLILLHEFNLVLFTYPDVVALPDPPENDWNFENYEADKRRKEAGQGGRQDMRSVPCKVHKGSAGSASMWALSLLFTLLRDFVKRRRICPFSIGLMAGTRQNYFALSVSSHALAPQLGKSCGPIWMMWQNYTDASDAAQFLDSVLFDNNQDRFSLSRQ